MTTMTVINETETFMTMSFNITTPPSSNITVNGSSTVGFINESSTVGFINESLTLPTTESSTISRIFLGLLLYTVVAITVLGNLLVLVAVLTDKRLQTVFNYYIVNLAVTDVLVALMAMSLYTTDNILGYWPMGEFMCGVWIFFDYGMTFASVFTLVVISVDRYWSVQWSVHYRNHHNKRKACIFIGCIWLVMLVLWLPPCITDRVNNSEPGVCMWEPSKNREFVIFVATVGHHAAFLVMVFCYIKVFVFMKRRAKLAPAKNHVPVSTVSQTNDNATDAGQTKQTMVSEKESESKTNEAPSAQGPSKQLQVKNVGNTNNANSKAQNNDKRERKVFVTLTYIIFGYVVCWLPFHIVFDISAIDPEAVPEVIFTITFWMTYLNSTINPFLYNFSSPEFRRAFKAILCCKKIRG